ncbi:hypothetical protein EG68_09058 [Paragonimus skrjabini miyazakii]|uniref:Uncharacterized protein n=1 Tax=Paragonimus skrjabini miyazakii TaxID=59628 RepID=A0A8S9YI37_9TREM|nr:hypothetical protein EG68_09058 [Paragonimus skrjabini miyazakii]
MCVASYLIVTTVSNQNRKICARSQVNHFFQSYIVCAYVFKFPASRTALRLYEQLVVRSYFLQKGHPIGGFGDSVPYLQHSGKSAALTSATSELSF